MSNFKCFPDSPAFPETHVYHWRSQEKGDNGQPYESDNVLPRYMGGLTKREYFAAMALSGIAKNSIHLTDEAGRSVDYEVCAMTAVSMAAALIAELNK